jgi:hypothetical protein
LQAVWSIVANLYAIRFHGFHDGQRQVCPSPRMLDNMRHRTAHGQSRPPSAMVLTKLPKQADFFVMFGNRRLKAFHE